MLRRTEPRVKLKLPSTFSSGSRTRPQSPVVLWWVKLAHGEETTLLLYHPSTHATCHRPQPPGHSAVPQAWLEITLPVIKCQTPNLPGFLGKVTQ